MSSNNPTKTDPSAAKTAGVDVHNHLPNAHNDAHPGSQASNNSGLHSQQVAGASETNTSTSLTGAGTAAVGGGGDFNLKSVRKQDGPAHSAPGGHIHGAPEEHITKE